MTIFELEQRIRKVPRRSMVQRHAAIRRLCLEFAKPLAAAVTLSEKHRLAFPGSLRSRLAQEEFETHLLSAALAREVLAALKEEKGDDDARRT